MIEFYGCEDKTVFKELSDKIKELYYLLPPYMPPHISGVEIKNVKGFAAIEFNQDNIMIPKLGEPKFSLTVTVGNRVEREKIGLIFKMLGLDQLE